MNAPSRRIHPTLPIFEVPDGARSILYAPGHVCVVTAAEAAAWRQAVAASAPAAGAPAAGGPPPAALTARTAWLRTLAAAAVADYAALARRPFVPECLCLYPTLACNLGCTYCYAAPARAHGGPALGQAAVDAAAALVLANCARAGRPFALVIHGGGEPTREWALLQHAVRSTKRRAAAAGVPWRGYVASHGVLDPGQAAWLGQHVGHVGLSLDGPPAIHDAQRPFRGGAPTYARVAETARVLGAAGARLELRTTITPATLTRQGEIAAELARALRPAVLRFEPLYRAGAAGFAPDDAAAFVEHYIEAEAAARAAGVALQFAGVRLDERHGPHCSVLRDTLQLVPDGSVMGCFFGLTGAPGPGGHPALGRFDPDAAAIVLDAAAVAAHRRHAARIPPPCQDCLCGLHCSRGCPELCVAAGADPRPDGGPAAFRCRVHRLLAEHWLRRAVAEQAAPARPDADAAIPLYPAPAAVPASAPAPAPARAAERAGYDVAARRQPDPLWATAGLPDPPATAWERLRAHAATARGPLSVYVHVPYCASRCAFCDCRAVPLGPPGRGREDALVAALVAELARWTAHIDGLAARPVTTIHFGGGTPGVLGLAHLDRLVRAFCASLSGLADAEWALESTSSLLTAAHLAGLRALGFTRLHVGVQTLHDGLRTALGRRGTGGTVLRRLERALAAGFVTSVDLLYGLPGQTARDFATTVERLCAAGVHGLSLYRLNVSPRNRRWLATRPGFRPDASADLQWLHEAEERLRACGFTKNHFVHYARPPDRNLYFRHALRGEDLLALGPTADGVFWGYHYRHVGLGGYLARGLPACLQGGIAETPTQRRLAPLEAALLAGAFTAADLQAVGVAPVLERWLAAGLVAAGPAGRFGLTASGSWLVSDMLRDVAAAACAPPPA